MIHEISRSGIFSVGPPRTLSGLKRDALPFFSLKAIPLMAMLNSRSLKGKCVFRFLRLTEEELRTFT